MSFYLADASGPLEDFASIGGLAEFSTWAKQQADPLRSFAKRGWTEDLSALQTELKNVPVPSQLREQVNVLSHVLHTAKDVLIITDGLSDEEEPHALSGSDNTPLHRAADKHLKSVQNVVEYAFAKGRKALGSLNASAPQRAAIAVHNALLDVLPKVLLDTMTSGGQAGLERLRSAQSPLKALAGKGPIKISFNNKDPKAIEWAKNHAAELAKGLSDTTLEDIREAIAEALEEGDLEASFDKIAGAVGDSARAEMIARTEIMRSANEGQRQGWDQAVERGLLDADTKRVWISTAGCCDECDELDGETTTLDGSYPGDGEDGPPLHPNCRCTEGITE